MVDFLCEITGGFLHLDDYNVNYCKDPWPMVEANHHNWIGWFDLETFSHQKNMTCEMIL